MFASSKVIIAALAFVGIASAQLQGSGSCPTNVNVIPDFDVEKYLGTWYEYAKYPVSFEADGKCITAEYTLQEDGNVGVVNSLINEANDEHDQIVGYAKPVSNAKLLVTFPVSPVYNATSNYWVLDTDYTSYAVVYSCQPISDDEHSTIVWILTRERQPTVELISEAANVLVQNGVSLKELVITNQSGCN